MSDHSELAALRNRLEEITSLRETGALLEWDMETYMPNGAAGSRGRQVSVISKLTHELFVSEETGSLLSAAKAVVKDAAYDSDDASLVRVSQRDYDQARKLPSEFVAEMTKTTTLAHGTWVEARKDNNFAHFAPALKSIFDLKKRQADYKGYTEHPYDALLDDYEPGLKTSQVAAMFADLRTEIVPLVAKINAKLNAVDDSPLHQAFDITKQREFAEYVVQKFGFDFNRGRQDVAVHPFCTSFSRDDVRITTRFDENWLSPALFGTLHEAGHGMYEQGSSPSLDGTLISGGTSLGVHESQSRLWENLIGRSLGFWKAFYPKLQETFPAQLGTVSLEAFYRAVNKVEPSHIRVEADEVNYNLHVLIRFELETEILSGKLKIEDIPEAWNAKCQTYLGITPPTNALGCLQDIHWSAGLIGYFPTYSMGTILSVQLYAKAVEAYPSIPTDMERGEFGYLLTWLRDNIHVHGRKFEPNELVQRATGEPLNAKYYVGYLKNKFGAIYGL